MTNVRHGISIGIERINNHLYLSFKAIGKLKHEDYEIMVPMIEAAMQGIEEPKIDALVDMTELDGWEARAAWDDFKLGLKHGKDFNRIAIIGNKKWEELSAKVGNWFISGEMKYFEDEETGCEWLVSE